MKFLAPAGMMLLLIICSIADIDLGDFPDTKANWDASQHPNADDDQFENGDYPGSRPVPFAECAQLRLRDTYIDEPTDGNCYAATMVMLRSMDLAGKDCVYMTNEGWIPAMNNPMTREQVNKLLEDSY